MKDKKSPVELAKELGVPLVKKTEKEEKKPIGGENKVLAVCGECGLQVRMVMHLVCQHKNCPIFLYK